MGLPVTVAFFIFGDGPPFIAQDDRALQLTALALDLRNGDEVAPRFGNGFAIGGLCVCWNNDEHRRHQGENHSQL